MISRAPHTALISASVFNPFSAKEFVLPVLVPPKNCPKERLAHQQHWFLRHFVPHWNAQEVNTRAVGYNYDVSDCQCRQTTSSEQGRVNKLSIRPSCATVLTGAINDDWFESDSSIHISTRDLPHMIASDITHTHHTHKHTHTHCSPLLSSDAKGNRLHCTLTGHCHRGSGSLWPHSAGGRCAWATATAVVKNWSFYCWIIVKNWLLYCWILV